MRLSPYGRRGQSHVNGYGSLAVTIVGHDFVEISAISSGAQDRVNAG
jgi:hypothetical protein